MKTAAVVMAIGPLSIAFGIASNAVGAVTGELAGLIREHGNLRSVFENAPFLKQYGSGMDKIATSIGGAQASAVSLSTTLGGLAGAAGVIAFSAWLANLYDKSTRASTEVRNLIKEIDSASGKYEATAREIDVNAAAAEELVRQLYALSEQSSVSAAEQEKMRMIVERLNDLYPELNLQLDKETRQLNLGKDAILARIAARKEELKLRAFEVRYVELLKQEQDLKSQLAQEELKLAENAEKAANSKLSLIGKMWQAAFASQDEFASIEALNKSLGENALAQDELSRMMAETSLEFGRSSEAADKTAGAMEDVADATGLYRDQLANMTDEERAANVERERSSAQTTQSLINDARDRTLASQTEQDKIAADMIREIQSRTERDRKAAELEARRVERDRQSFDRLRSQAESYEQDREAAYGRHVQAMGSLDDERIRQSDLTAEKALENMRRQIQDMESWGANMEGLAGRIPRDA